ncbi:MAG: DUF1295 domain-containing protein [Spirochaetes bacterium]|nr:DUF1295 domain-containing protein [Spirochaetota bacterium]
MIESIVQIIVTNFASILAFFTLAWIISLIVKDASIADVFWGLGFILVALLTYILFHGYSVRAAIIVILVILWGLRLSVYIFYRKRGKGEDPRYTAMRNKNPGSFWIISLFKVFWLQGLLLTIISLSAQIGIAAESPKEILISDYIGITIWLTGFIFETVADIQLYQFIHNPANTGKVMNQGLWRYSRHPNYFGESLMWWGIFIIVIPVPYGIATIISPLLITYLLLKVSGITLLESSLKEKRPEYAEYIKTTSAFLPLPKRKL